MPGLMAAWWHYVLSGILFVIAISLVEWLYKHVSFYYRRKRAAKQMIIFEATMRMVREGTFVGTPISPNDQVLRAECNCGASRPSPSRVFLYDRTFFPLSESSFSALSAGSCTRIPALDCTTRTLDSSATASSTFTLSANNRFEI